MGMKTQVVLFCVLTPCSDVIGNQYFGGSCCLHLQFTLKMEAALISETRRQSPDDDDLKIVYLLWLYYEYIFTLTKLLFLIAMAPRSDRWMH